MSSKYQIFHNAIFNSASWIFSIVLSFIFLPYIVQKMGAEAYGVLALVLSMIGYLAVLDLNLGDAIIKYVAEYRAEGNMVKINEVISSVILLYLVFGILGGLSILLLSDTIVSRWLDINSDLKPAAQFAFNVGSVGILFTMLLTALSAIPNGTNRYDITSKINMAMGLITTVATVLLLYCGQGLKEIVVLNLVISLLGIIIYGIVSKTLLPGLVLRPSFSLSAIRKVLNYGLFSTLSRVSGIMHLEGIRLLAGVILGVAYVTYYIVPFNLVSKVMAITSQLGMVIFPVISSMQGKKDFESVITLYLKSSRIILTISTAISLPLLLFGDLFIKLWMGQDFKEHTSEVMLLLTLSLYLDAWTNTPSYVANGLGMPKICGFFAILDTIINLVLIYPLSEWLNIDGVALSFLLAKVIVSPIFVIYVNNKLLKLSLIKLLKEVYLLPTVAGLISALILMVCVPSKVDNMISLLGIMMASTVLYLVIAILIGVFSKEEKDHCIGYLQLNRKRLAKVRV